MAQGGTHEDLTRKTKIPVGSDRSFGLVFTGFFVLVGAAPLLHGGEPRWWALGAATGFLLAALLVPKALRPLNLLWFRFGQALHLVVTPVVMGLLFFLTITPIGLLMRLSGKDPLRLKRDGQAVSYWIKRQPPGPTPDSMRHQF